MRKICVALSKGGVAKSSTSVSLACGLALRGKRVLLVDTDDQGQDAFLLGIDVENGLDEVLSGAANAHQAILKCKENLYVMPSGKNLSKAKRDIGKKDFRAEDSLKESLRCIEGEFDFVIVDTAPSFDTLTVNALFYCEEVITPVSLEVLTLNSLKDFAKKIKRIQQHHPNLKHSLVLPTFYDRRVKKSLEILEILKKHYADKICEPIRYNVKISECAGYGTSIFDFAPKSAGSKDYEKFVEKVLKYDAQ